MSGEGQGTEDVCLRSPVVREKEGSMRDEKDLLAPGLPTLSPLPQHPKPSPALRPQPLPLQLGSYHTDSAWTLLYVCLPSALHPNPCPLGPPSLHTCSLLFK